MGFEQNQAMISQSAVLGDNKPFHPSQVRVAYGKLDLPNLSKHLNNSEQSIREQAIEQIDSISSTPNKLAESLIVDDLMKSLPKLLGDNSKKVRHHTTSFILRAAKTPHGRSALQRNNIIPALKTKIDEETNEDIKSSLLESVSLFASSPIELSNLLQADLFGTLITVLGKTADDNCLFYALETIIKLHRYSDPSYFQALIEALEQLLKEDPNWPIVTSIGRAFVAVSFQPQSKELAVSSGIIVPLITFVNKAGDEALANNNDETWAALEVLLTATASLGASMDGRPFLEEPSLEWAKWFGVDIPTSVAAALTQALITACEIPSVRLNLPKIAVAMEFFQDKVVAKEPTTDNLILGRSCQDILRLLSWQP